MKLNLGCGNDLREGWVNVDKDARFSPDVVRDLDEIPWPWFDNSVDQVYMRNVIDHLRDVNATMAELYRILKPGGLLVLIVPIGRCRFNDPTCEHYFSPHSIRYYVKNGYHIHYIPKLFTLLSAKKRRTSFPVYHLSKYLGLDTKLNILPNSIEWRLSK